MVDMQHLEIVTRAANQHLDVLCKNVLYSNFRSGSRSVSGMLRDPDSWRRIGQLGRLNARGYVEQLDLVRQVLNPPKHEWVALAFFCMSSLNSMMKECHSQGYMPGICGGGSRIYPKEVPLERYEGFQDGRSWDQLRRAPDR